MGPGVRMPGVADEYIKTRLVQVIGNLADPSLDGALLGDVGDRQRYSTVRRGGKVVHLVVVERGAEDLVALCGQLECNLATEPASCAGDCRCAGSCCRGLHVVSLVTRRYRPIVTVASVSRRGVFEQSQWIT
jgi:hypothetical protein